MTRRLPPSAELALTGLQAMAAGLAFGLGAPWIGTALSIGATVAARGLYRSTLSPWRAVQSAVSRSKRSVEGIADAASPAEIVEALGRELESNRTSRRYLDEVIETMAGALILADPERRILRVNPATLSLTGFAKHELVGQSLDIIFPDREPVNTGSLIHLSTTGRVRDLERAFLHKDGSRIPVLFSGTALRDADGTLREYVFAAYDIRRNKEIEAQLQASVAEKELLLREVHHRVKNNLQVVSSLLDLQSEHVKDPRDLDWLRDSRHRIRSMALIHEQLYRHDDLSDVGLGPYLESIASHLFRSFGVEPGRVALRCRLDEISIDLDRAVSCGLIANELLSNCLEHAFPDTESGQIHLTVGHRPGGLLQLSVADDGRGFDVEADRSQSMGLDLVDMMAQQLRGRLHLESSPDGSRFSIEFPADPTQETAWTAASEATS